MAIRILTADRLVPVVGSSVSVTLHGATQERLVFSGAVYSAAIIETRYDPTLKLRETLVELSAGSAGTSQLRLVGSLEQIIGSRGADTIRGGDLAEVLRGDPMTGGAGSGDLILARGGHDAVHAGPGHDTVYGGSGADLLRGGTGDDRLLGDQGADLIYGDRGNDSLFGGDSTDALFGGAGKDRLTGGRGSDSLTGGSGADRFIFKDIAESSPVSGFGADRIRDFSRREGDKIDLSALDANGSRPGLGEIDFIGRAAFDGTRGQLRYGFHPSGDTRILLDVNGDRIADFMIVLTNIRLHMQERDFIL
ncbi:calcium-binding protein [Gemmobacter serpentinus]|uniref:calcium-binding protein n=1 Tax=Gemmobacter serpentinus TaxID=2652247 RepID=UPI00124E5F3A|nr:M10 family metallopeptidase C-terminal domain-containing protein [Gemmobacter serpentinus]